MSHPGPDFLCIGMGKSGTGWLYDQLQHHSDFWMPPIKELHYLDRVSPKLGSAKKIRPRSKKREEKIGPSKSERRIIDQKDVDFIQEARAVRDNGMDLDFYADMFRFKEGKLSGDISPSYCTMDGAQIARVMTAFPALKVILMVRDPVVRAWSHFSMKSRGYKVSKDMLFDPREFRDHLEESKATRMGSPAHITTRWMRHVPPSRYRYYFFDDLQNDPDYIRRDVCEFLGADPANAGPVEAGYNRKAEKPKLELPADIRVVLVKHFASELNTCAKLFGGHAVEWARKYGVGMD